MFDVENAMEYRLALRTSPINMSLYLGLLKNYKQDNYS